MVILFINKYNFFNLFIQNNFLINFPIRAKDNGASVYCHWFQPLGASGVRHGMSGQVQNHFFEFNNDGVPVWDFKGKNILKGRKVKKIFK